MNRFLAAWCRPGTSTPARAATLAALLALPALTTPGPLLAADWKPLQGTYAISAENYLDPSDAERKNSHIRFQLTGRAAQDLYDAMQVKPVKDECTGGVVKKVGEMQCTRRADGKRIECSFSIDVMKQSIGYGVAC